MTAAAAAQVQVVDMRKTLCERDHTVHMEFKAAVRVGGEQWIVSRRFKQFYALHKHLKSA